MNKGVWWMPRHVEQKKDAANGETRRGVVSTHYIGDTKGDCDASKEAGVPFIFASYGFGNVTEYAAKIGEMKDLLMLFSGQ